MLDFDVAILGGGLAGNLMARQLRRTLPEASVVLFEKDVETSWKVGESTVEIASNYLTRRQGLSTYLYSYQLPKNSLRFFFDTKERNAPLTRMSELGSSHFPPFPSFQIDRARFESDLLRFNRELGVEAHVGWSVRDVELGEGGARHVITARGDGEEKQVRARWVVDAAGRANVLARKLDLRIPAPHPLSSIWARYTDIVDLDDVRPGQTSDTPEEIRDWRARVRNTPRVLSTVHFCYPGYWIWFIPLSRGVTSVGVVGEKHIFREGMRTQEGFRKFLDEHHAVRELMAPSKPLDIGGFTQLAYATKRFFGRDRWACVGDAAAFTDPFYSPGSDFIAIENDLVTDLISRDLRGDSSEPLGELTDTYDAFMKFRFDATLLLYQGQYCTLGSFPILRLKWNCDLGCYFNLWTDAYMRDAHLDPRDVRSQLRRSSWILQGVRNFRDLFESLARRGLENGSYYARNLGEYNNSADFMSAMPGFSEEIGQPRKRQQINRRTEEIFNYVRREALELLGEAPTDLALADFMEERSLA